MVLLIITSIFCISFFLFFRAYQIGVKGRLDLVKDWNDIQLPNPHSHRIAFIWLYVVSGVIFILTTVTLIAFKATLVNWWPLGFTCFFAAYHRNYISKRARGEINFNKPNDALVKLSNYHTAVLILYLLFSLVALLAGVILLVTGKDEGVWKLLMSGVVGVWLAIKVISIKYVKK
ncbi:hypothetical protein GALL_178830 [mine drainage metagenome]|uniref:Uncharacterized protein n=1 Tax=mine drainage metagenome TaxID=410659 RepID=A0A1J5SIW6_9ZZZZ